MIDAIGGRKVLVTLIAFIVGVACVAWKGDMPPNFLALVLGLTGMYIAGNVFESKGQAAQVDLTDVHAKLDVLSNAAATTQGGVSALVNFVNQSPQK